MSEMSLGRKQGDRLPLGDGKVDTQASAALHIRNTQQQTTAIYRYASMVATHSERSNLRIQRGEGVFRAGAE